MSGAGTGLLLSKSGGVATITLNRPERANALDPAEFHALAALLASLAADSGLRAVVLTGKGERAFCSGLNLRNREAIEHDLRSSGPTGLGSVLRRAAEIPVPIIGRINGACVAGGMGLLGVCDHVVASDTARFGLPEISHGIYPFVAIAGLHNRGSKSMVRQLCDTGAMIDADTALREGLVHEVCTPAELDGRIAAILDDPALGRSRAARNAGEFLFMVDQAEQQARAARSVIVNS